MNLYLSNIQWINPGDPLSGMIGNIRIRNGAVQEWGENLIPEKNELIIDGKNSFCSPGWLDLKTRIGEPSQPQNESLDSLFRSAAAGGYTRILIYPDTQNIIQTLESVSFYSNIKNDQGIKVLVAAAGSLNLEGKKMSEMLTLRKAGAVAFATVKPIQDSGFFSQILLYLKETKTPVIHFPQDQNLCIGGQIHEGEVSDRRGLGGIPEVAETIFVHRDIEIAAFTGGTVHLSSLSSPRSLELVSNARQKGVSISADLAAHQLAFTDESVEKFDTHYKVSPPFRTEKHRLGLIQAIRENKVQAVVSDHSPWHYDFKICPFDLAEFGISSLETTFSCLNTFVDSIEKDQIVNLLAIGPRKILGFEQPLLKVGLPADFTLFDTDRRWTPNPVSWLSKSKNTPFFGMNLKGVVLGIVTESGFTPNPHSE